MDVVIALGVRDCIIVHKTIKYVFLNLVPEHIYLITNISNKTFFSSAFCKKYNISIIDENNLLPYLSFAKVAELIKKRCSWNNYGWYLQQFLKMGFALSPYAKDKYLVWDSDTIPLRKLSFFDDGNYFFTKKTEYNKPYFDTIKKLIGIDRQVDYSFVAEHMMFDVKIMKELVDNIEQSSIEGETWVEKIINAMDIYNTEKKSGYAFSEFETYGNYFAKKYPQKLKISNVNSFRQGGKLYGRGVTTSQLKKLSEKYDTVSFELRDFPPFPWNIYHFGEALFMTVLKKWKAK